MCRDGTESASSKTPTVDIYRELYHLVGWYALTLVFRVWQSGVGKVKGGIEFLGCHWREWRVDHHSLVAYVLQKPTGVHLV